MSLHDEYARVTTFELAYPDRERFEALVAAVAREGAHRGMDPTDPDVFAALEAVGSFLAAHHGEDVPRVELIQHGVLLFHAAHFAGAECPLYLLDRETTRQLVRTAPSTDPTPPAHAGYLQLPQHLFWTGGAEGGAPESVDGLFWTMSRSGRLHVLVVVGVRPDRPGFGAVSLPDAPVAHAADWMHASVRETGDDYASRLPGAQLDELYSIEAAGEVLKLLARFFAHATATGGVREAAAPIPDGAGPQPSSLPYTRVRGAA